MSFLPKYFRQSEHTYYTTQSSDALTKKLDDIFSKSILDISSNWRGRFINPNEFVATRKFNFLVSDLPFDFAVIYGKINASDNKTKIDLRITQNNSLTFLYVLSFIIGILCLSAAIVRPNKPNWLEVFITGLVFTLVAPLVLMYVGQLNKQFFEDAFLKSIGLNK